MLTTASAAMVLTIATQSVANSPPKQECQNLGKMYGLFMKASVQCNFPESAAIQKTISRLKIVCPSATEAQARAYIASGFAEFERQVRRDGEAKTCRKTYLFMEAVGQ